MTHLQRLNVIKQAIAPLDMTMTTNATKQYREKQAGNDCLWLATNGERGNYSALNVGCEPGKEMYRGTSFEEMTMNGNKRALLVAEKLFDAGLTIFCAVDLFKGADQKFHVAAAHDQICISHI